MTTRRSLCFRRCSVFFFNDTATTELYTLSLHDALPISASVSTRCSRTAFSAAWVRSVTSSLRRMEETWAFTVFSESESRSADRKSTRLNSSHSSISYAVFCLKKKKQKSDLPGEHRQTRP